MNTTLNQPNSRRVSTDRLNRGKTAIWLKSLERESSPTPVGKTLPNSYPKIRFRRERARDVTSIALKLYLLLLCDINSISTVVQQLLYDDHDLVR